MSSVVNGHSQCTEIDAGDWQVLAVAFTPNGRYLVGGGPGGIVVWQVKDGERVATIPVKNGVWSVAVSRNDEWIAAGSWGEVLAWDATTHGQVFAGKVEGSKCAIRDVDFSPYSPRLVSADGGSHTATIWDIAARRNAQMFHHGSPVRAARYSPQGERIATATPNCVRLWDSDNGCFLLNIQVEVNLWRGLLWYKNHLFVKTKDNKIKRIEASTGSVLSEWSVPATSSSIAIPQHGRFIAYSSKDDVTLWAIPSHTQLGLIPLGHDKCSLAFSPTDRRLAIVTQERTIVITDISLIKEPEIRIENTALDAWKHARLTSAETLLTIPIQTPKVAAYTLASRALVRARLGNWGAAIADAEKSIKIRSSAIGYIAKCVTLVGKGRLNEGCRVCDIAFQLHPEHISLFLLIKAIVLFMAGEYADAISRMDDLVTVKFFDPTFYVVQAYMHFYLGNLRMDSGEYKRAIQSFELARIKLGGSTDQPLLIISLISGWKFDDLAITIQQRLGEALFFGGRVKEAGETALRVIDQDINMAESVKARISGVLRRCLSIPQNNGSVRQATRDNSTQTPGFRPLFAGWVKLILTSGTWGDALTAATDFLLPKFTIYQVICDHLEMKDRIADALACFHQMFNELAPEIDDERADWSDDFKSRCQRKLENLGDISANARRFDDAISQYTTALSLNPAVLHDLLLKRSNASMEKGAQEDALNDAKEWVKSMLMKGSWDDALVAAAGFRMPRSTIYQVICERLETTNHVTDVVACFHEMCGREGWGIDEERVNWARDFKFRCRRRLEDLGDIAMKTRQYHRAILLYTTAVSLNPPILQGLFGKRSEAYAGKEEWENALNDANRVIELDPSSPLGYERKHAAFHGIGRFDDATHAFETMLSKVSESSDPVIYERSRRYVGPERTKEAIRTTIRETIRDSPPVLINTVSGRLCNKSEQTSTFEATPMFMELVSSMCMTTDIDHTRIRQQVEEYFRYTTFSHKWEENEPLFEKVIRIVVFDLEASSTHEKLQMFCKIVREAGFNWAWSDTCCINKADHLVLQEALVSMFKWYEGSAMTIIFLRGVPRLARRGALTRSLWNMRAWTLQEYHASKVVKFYTEDWTPYLGLDIYNHKDSPEIISEMEEATGISARALMALRPGLGDIREKLRLASMRQTTRAEDAAYSLLGIFSLSLPITYGEGDQALGRLLAQLLTSSGDTSILAWTGRSGSFNSSLPASISVFSRLPTSHIPPTLPDAEMRTISAGWHSFDLALAAKLHDRLHELSVPSVTGQRIKLPCLTFRLGRVSLSSKDGSMCFFHARTDALGVVEIRTEENLSQYSSLCLIHPWIDFLLDRRPLPDSSSTPYIVPSEFLSPPTTMSPAEKQMRVLQFIARLQQPFGALLLMLTRRNVEEYKRVAAESLITVQVEAITSAMLEGLIQGVRMLDVL